MSSRGSRRAHSQKTGGIICSASTCSAHVSASHRIFFRVLPSPTTGPPAPLAFTAELSPLELSYFRSFSSTDKTETVRGVQSLNKSLWTRGFRVDPTPYTHTLHAEDALERSKKLKPLSRSVQKTESPCMLRPQKIPALASDLRGSCGPVLQFCRCARVATRLRSST